MKLREKVIEYNAFVVHAFSLSIFDRLKHISEDESCPSEAQKTH